MAQNNTGKKKKGKKPKKAKGNPQKQQRSNKFAKARDFQTLSVDLSKNKSLSNSPQSSFIAQLDMLSDWHIGTGVGRPGNIDSLIQRDRDGLPYIPAKTLTGIWRDACEVVALGLDNGHLAGPWSHWVNYLFGDQPALAKRTVLSPPQPAALSIRGAYLPEPLRAAILTHSSMDQIRLKESITFIKPGISIDPDTGCAREDFLRFEEMVRAGTILVANCQFYLDCLNLEQKNAAYALMVAGSQLIERIGGKRRRGAGRCQLVIQKDNPDFWLDWLGAHLTPPELPQTQPDLHQTNWNQYQTVQSNGGWFALPLKVTTKSPLIITKRTIGNVVETLDYIPGTHLLPIITRKLKSLNINLGGAIAHGELVVTNATLSISGHAGRPVPYALFGEKLEGGLEKGKKVYNRLCETSNINKQLKGERRGYIGITSKDHLPSYDTVTVGVNTHNTIQDQYQCPTKDVGGVYTYEAISIGTEFYCELRVPDRLAHQLSEKDSRWWEKLAGKNQLGQSKKDGYGLVKIETQSPPTNIKATAVTQQSELTVWLISDLLLRDERLRPTADPAVFTQQLSSQLEVSLKLREYTENQLSQIARQNRLESWQVRWGLPRPSLAGLAAGSCFVFTVDGKLEQAKLTKLAITGLGERRAEGYGQLCFNDPILTTSLSDRESLSESKTSESSSILTQRLLKTSANSKLIDYTRVIEQAALRKLIRQNSLILATSKEKREQICGFTKNQPTMSQLSALRSVINQLQNPERPDQTNGVVGWLNRIQTVPDRKKKWTEDSLELVETIVCEQQKIWQILAIDFSTLVLIEREGQWLRKRLWAEAVKTLLDACIRAHKRELEKIERENNNG